MNFSGFVPLRRSILEHTMTGALSSNEFMVLVTLIMLADHKTGRGTINAPAIRTYLPGLKYSSAKDALESLEKSGYIWRKITFKSKLVYPYWVNRYEITDGEYKNLQTDLSQVVVSNNPKDIRYIDPPPQTPLERYPYTRPDDPPYTRPDDPLYNNKDNNKDINNNNDNTLPVIEKMANDGDSCLKVADSVANSSRDPAMANSGHSLPIASRPNPSSSSGEGLKWSGPHGGYLDGSGRVVSLDRAWVRISTVGLELRGADFFEKDTGDAVPWNLAQRRISGSTNERSAVQWAQ